MAVCARCGISPFYVPRSNPDGWGVSFQCIQVHPGTGRPLFFASFPLYVFWFVVVFLYRAAALPRLGRSAVPLSASRLPFDIGYRSMRVWQGGTISSVEVKRFDGLHWEEHIAGAGKRLDSSAPLAAGRAGLLVTRPASTLAAGCRRGD